MILQERVITLVCGVLWCVVLCVVIILCCVVCVCVIFILSSMVVCYVCVCVLCSCGCVVWAFSTVKNLKTHLQHFNRLCNTIHAEIHLKIT